MMGGSTPEPCDLVLDIGTSAVKAGLVSRAGEVIASAERPLPGPLGENGVSEQDAQAWWTASCEAAAALTSESGSAVERIVLTGQMQTLTLVDAGGRPLRPTLSYGDVRAQAEAAEVTKTLGEATLRGWTGNDTDASSLLAKAVWLARNERDVLERAHGVHLGAADHVAFRLSGEAVCDTTTASTTGLLDLSSGRALAGDAFQALGVAGFASRLPSFAPGGAEVGRVREAEAAAWGVPAGTPVHVGPGDAGASTIGAGAGVRGAASLYLGTSGWLAFTAPTVGRAEAGVFTLAHPAAGSFFQVAPLLTASGNLAWFRDALLPGEAMDDLIDAALAQAALPQGATPPAAAPLTYLPYLAGERAPFRDPHLRGAFVGLSTTTTREDMARAVLEGVAFAYRHAAEALQVASPSQDDTPWVVSGGGARSRAWMQLFADVLGRPLRILKDATWVGVLGAWHAARVARGDADGWQVPVEGEVLRPRATTAEGGDPELDRRYRRFRATTDALRTLSAQ